MRSHFFYFKEIVCQIGFVIGTNVVSQSREHGGVAKAFYPKMLKYPFKFNTFILLYLYYKSI